CALALAACMVERGFEIDAFGGDGREFIAFHRIDELGLHALASHPMAAEITFEILTHASLLGRRPSQPRRPRLTSFARVNAYRRAWSPYARNRICWPNIPRRAKSRS